MSCARHQRPLQGISFAGSTIRFKDLSGLGFVSVIGSRLTAYVIASEYLPLHGGRVADQKPCAYGVRCGSAPITDGPEDIAECP